MVDVGLALAAVGGVQPGGEVQRAADPPPVWVGEAGDLQREPFPQPCLATQGGDRVQRHGCQPPPLARCHASVRSRPRRSRVSRSSRPPPPGIPAVVHHRRAISMPHRLLSFRPGSAPPGSQVLCPVSCHMRHETPPTCGASTWLPVVGRFVVTDHETTPQTRDRASVSFTLKPLARRRHRAAWPCCSPSTPSCRRGG